MSRRGENIYKRKDNRFEGRYIKGYGPDGKAKFGYVYAKTYKEAKEKLINLKANPQKELQSVKKNVGEFCDEWLKLKRSMVSLPFCLSLSFSLTSVFFICVKVRIIKE